MSKLNLNWNDTAVKIGKVEVKFKCKIDEDKEFYCDNSSKAILLASLCGSANLSYKCFEYLDRVLIKRVKP